MTRLTWTTGDKATPWREVDTDSLSLTTAWQRVLKLIGLVSDMATGANTPPITLDASGVSGKGCPLGVPLAQEIRRKVPYAVNSTEGGYLAICPIYLPDGEDSFRVELDHCPRLESLNVKFQILQPSDFTVLAERDPVYLDHLVTKPAIATFTGLDDGDGYILAVAADLTSGNVGAGGALRVVFPRMGSVIGPDPTKGIGDDISLNTQAGATSAVIADLVDLDSTWIGDEYPIDARSVDAAARNLATLDEMILGRPAMGANASYTLANSTGDSDPADDAFLSGSRSLYANEPVMDFPLWTWHGGVCPGDGGLGNTLGRVTDDGYPPGVKANISGGTALVYQAGMFPDFKVSDGTGLRVTALFYSPDGSVAGVGSTPRFWVRAYDETLSTMATSTQVHGSWSNPTGNWHVAEVTLADFNEDKIGMIGVGYDTSVGVMKANDGSSLRLAGCSAYFVKV